jgi:coenzyme PQQ precursor peptide PqqA
LRALDESGILTRSRFAAFSSNYQGVAKMTWTKPEFKAISLSMEVTFYVNSR